MAELFLNLFHTLHAQIFEAIVLPVVRATEQTAFTAEAFDGTEAFLIGLIEITLLFVFFRPLEIWRPAEAFVNRENRKTDIFYTLLHRLGGFALISFALLTPLLDGIEGELRLQGISRFQLDEAPFFSESPLLLLIVYLIVFDFVGYWIHRAQHRMNLWWQLHALHHANTSMSLWSDNRNHLIDDMLLDIIMAIVAWFIGVEPAQYVVLVMVTRLLQSLQHANTRMTFGWLGERLLVSPQFHRVHHAISSGNEGRAMGCNFGVVLPWWDVLFGTSNYTTAIEPTGVRDALQGRDYGTGFWAQQRLGFLRLLGKA